MEVLSRSPRCSVQRPQRPQCQGTFAAIVDCSLDPSISSIRKQRNPSTNRGFSEPHPRTTHVAKADWPETHPSRECYGQWYTPCLEAQNALIVLGLRCLRIEIG